MEKQELKQKIYALQVAKKKFENSLQGDKIVITYRGTVITFSSAASIAEGYQLVKNVQNTFYQVTNIGAITDVKSLLGIGIFTILLPSTLAIFGYEIMNLKENLRIKKVNEKCLTKCKDEIEAIRNSI